MVMKTEAPFDAISAPKEKFVKQGRPVGPQVVKIGQQN